MAEGHISPWLPDRDRHRLAILGKLIEECSELSARAARCIIQGIDEIDPDTGRANRIELEREISDVMAGIEMCHAHLGTRTDYGRQRDKRAGYERWHQMLEEQHSSERRGRDEAQSFEFKGRTYARTEELVTRAGTQRRVIRSLEIDNG